MNSLQTAKSFGSTWSGRRTVIEFGANVANRESECKPQEPRPPIKRAGHRRSARPEPTLAKSKRRQFTTPERASKGRQGQWTRGRPGRKRRQSPARARGELQASLSGILPGHRQTSLKYLD